MRGMAVSDVAGNVPAWLASSMLDGFLWMGVMA